jgi:hypothetical protein
MTLGNMRQLGVLPLVACCLNDACRPSAPGRLREMRYAWSAHRCPAELERATLTNPDRQTLALTRLSANELVGGYDRVDRGPDLYNGD